MIALSIKLPDELAEISRRTAEKIGISRSELIRRALVHEIDAIQAKAERRAMAESMRQLARNDTARKQSDLLDSCLSETLPEEKDEWWNG